MRRLSLLSSLLPILLLSPTVVPARVIQVPAGGNLQQAINVARAGDVIALDNGATFVGNFILPRRGDGDGIVVIRPARLDGLPAAGERVMPATARALPRLHSPNGAPALRTAPAASGWRIELIELTALEDGPGEILALGDGSAGQRRLADVPHDLVIDRCYVHGSAERAQKRCIALNSASTTVSGSFVADCKAEGQDSQAIAGWNGPGPFTITNNYLEGAGENILFGGGDPAIDGLVPSDILIAGNTIEKPLTWRGSRWQVKNLLELKNARRVTIRDNQLRHNWQAAQSGFAILLTVRNQDGGCPWCEVSQVVIERNRIEKIAAAISILGRDDVHQSRAAFDITIRHNLVTELDSRAWGGSGYFLLLLGGPARVIVTNNTVVQPHAAGLIQVEGPPVESFVFANNVARHSEYGIIGTGRAPGQDTLAAYFPGARVIGNVIAGADRGRYPSGNSYPPAEEFDRQFLAADKGDYRLRDSQASRLTASQDGPPGADLTAIPSSRK